MTFLFVGWMLFLILKGLAWVILAARCSPEAALHLALVLETKERGGVRVPSERRRP